jgi:3D (Asp-Asp-Asp) domain-containing protein
MIMKIRRKNINNMGNTAIIQKAIDSHEKTKEYFRLWGIIIISLIMGTIIFNLLAGFFVTHEVLAATTFDIALPRPQLGAQRVHRVTDSIPSAISEELFVLRKRLALLENALGIRVDDKPVVYVDEFVTTAYAPAAGGINCSGDCNTTAKLFKVSAIKDLDNITYCAVDPKVIPLYSVLIIQGYDKPCVAVDTGMGVKGKHIDILMHDHREAIKWGKRRAKVIVVYPSY